MKIIISIMVLVGLLGQADVPTFEIWVECVQRGPYPGQAMARLSYRYDGGFPVTAEDSRYFGDTSSGETQIFTFSIEPGEHIGFMAIPVGANKVMLWKIILFEKLHVVTIYDDPLVRDCDWDEFAPTATPTAEAPNL